MENLGSARQVVVNAHLLRAFDRSNDEALTWFRTGANDEELNGVLRLAPERIEESLLLMEGSRGLWHSWQSDPRQEELQRRLSERGFTFAEEEPVMARTVAPIEAECVSVPGLRHRVADTVADLVEWVEIWRGTPEGSAGIADALSPFGLGSRRAAHYVVAFLENMPVGCFAVVITSGGAAIEHVVTVAEYRRRGIGTALTAAALNIASQQGAAIAALTASPDGRSIYEQIGFREVDRVRRFRPPAG